MGTSPAYANGRATAKAVAPSKQEAVSNPWRLWLIENRLAGISDDDIVSVMVRNGFNRNTALQELASLKSDLAFQAADRTNQRLRKLESFLNVRQSLSSLAFGAGTIERRSRISRAEFRERYYAVNRPVILTGLLEGIPAMQRWSPSYLRKAVGEAMVEIMVGRNNDARYEINAQSHRQEMRFADYVDLVMKPGAGNDAYLVANNGVFQRPAFKPLFEDVPALTDYLDPSLTAGQVFLWFGPAGTVTPLHHDVMNVLAAEVYGRKRFTLIPPNQSHLVYNNIGVYSEVDCERPDFDRHPLYKRAKPLSVVLEPGEVLFIPVGWWHHVRALDVAIMVSYTNFAFPNSYEWHHPHIQA